MRTRTSLLAIALAALLSCGVASASAKVTRASRSVAGVRFTLDQWAGLLLTDKAKAACAMLTPAGQKVWAKDNDSSTCVAASLADYKFFKLNPTDATAVREYGNKEPVTLKGDTASLPKLAGGTRTLLYKHGLWYINS